MKAILFSFLFCLSTVCMSQVVGDSNLDMKFDDIKLKSFLNLKPSLLDKPITFIPANAFQTGVFHSEVKTVNYLNPFLCTNPMESGFTESFLGYQSDSNFRFLNTNWTNKYVFDLNGNLVDSEVSFKFKSSN